MGQIPSKTGASRAPSSSLSGDQKAAIRASWSALEGKEREIGVAFFSRLFAAHPEYQNAFGRVKGVAASDLASNKALAVHATTFMKGLGTLVSQIDDAAGTDEMLWKIAVRHRPYGLQVFDMQRAANILVEVLKANGQGGAAPAWQAALDLAMPIIAAYTADAY